MMTTPRPIADLIIDDLGGAFSVALGYIGDKLGLFAALAAATRSTSRDVAERASLDERYVREWLNAMVAARYIERNRDDDSYFLTPEQKAALVDEGGPHLCGRCVSARPAVDPDDPAAHRGIPRRGRDFVRRAAA